MSSASVFDLDAIVIPLPPARICATPGCRTKLSRYNPDDRCHACKHLAAKMLRRICACGCGLQISGYRAGCKYIAGHRQVKQCGA